jgi:hypothetical protein
MIRGVSFSGKQGAGKTTILKAVKAELERTGAKVHVISFAEPVKSLSKAVLVDLGLVVADTPEPQWKYQFRKILQTVGNHLRGYDVDVWVKLAESRIQSLPSDVYVLNDDCRFPNEAESLKACGLYLVRIEADRALRQQRLGTLSNEDHPSETSLDQWEGFDITLYQTANTPPALPHVYAREILQRAGMPVAPEAYQSKLNECCGVRSTEAHLEWCPTLNGAFDITV